MRRGARRLRRPHARAGAGRRRRRDHDGPLPRRGPGGRDQARPDAGLRGRPRGRAGDARAAGRPAAAGHACSARSTAGTERRRRPAAGAGSSIRSTAPRATCAGMPVWATLLALEEDGEIAVGVVSAPALGRRWWAARGDGAFTADVPAASRAGCGSPPSASSATPSCASAAWRSGAQTGRLDGLLELARACWRTRGYGDFWQYMLVAEGAAEIAAGPGGVAVGPGRADGHRPGGRRPLHRPRRQRHRRGRPRGSAQTGLVHEAARRILAD